jgi:hypothetical protein
LIRQWLSPDGVKWFEDQSLEGKDALWTEAHAPIVLTLAVDPGTMGIGATKNGKDDKDSAAALDHPEGLVIRDPAAGVLQIGKGNRAASGSLVETTDDVSPRLSVALPQFGRLIVLPQHTAVFGNSTLSVKLSPDGSIASVGYHNASTAAAGVAGLGNAAGAASNAIIARNTAIGAEYTALGAQNTAKVTQSTFADTVNKALSDCLTSQATIIKSGGTPTVPCQ